MKQDNICGYCKEEIGYCKCNEEVKSLKKTRGKTIRYSLNYDKILGGNKMESVKKY